VALSDDVSRIAEAAARFAAPGETLGAGAAGDVAGALQGALPAIDELTRDLELNYKLELE